MHAVAFGRLDRGAMPLKELERVSRLYGPVTVSRRAGQGPDAITSVSPTVPSLNLKAAVARRSNGTKMGVARPPLIRVRRVGALSKRKTGRFHQRKKAREEGIAGPGRL